MANSHSRVQSTFFLMLLALLNFALSIAIIVAAIWALSTLAQIRKNQRLLFVELDRIGAALGIVRQQPMIRCACGNFFEPDLTGCPHCGRAKAADAEAESVPSQPR